MLDEIAALEAYKFMIIFTRLAVMFMVMPILSTAFIYARFRLCAALAVTVALYPSVAPFVPAMPVSTMGLLLLVFYEITVAAFFCLFMHIVFTALEVAGAQTTFSVGFSNSMVFDPFQGQQTMLLNSFLYMCATLLILTTDLHHLMFRAMADSYSLFRPGAPLPLQDMANTLSMTLTKSFKVGLEISFPFIVLTFAMQLGMAVIAKLMPHLNILFIAMPAQIYFGMGLFSFLIGVFLMYFVKYYEDSILAFIG